MKQARKKMSTSLLRLKTKPGERLHKHINRRYTHAHTHARTQQTNTSARMFANRCLTDLPWHCGILFADYESAAPLFGRAAQIYRYAN